MHFHSEFTYLNCNFVLFFTVKLQKEKLRGGKLYLVKKSFIELKLQFQHLSIGTSLSPCELSLSTVGRENEEIVTKQRRPNWKTQL